MNLKARKSDSSETKAEITHGKHSTRNMILSALDQIFSSCMHSRFFTLETCCPCPESKTNCSISWFNGTDHYVVT